MKYAYSLIVLSMLAVLPVDANAGLFPGKCKPVGCCDTVDCNPCNYACCPTVKTEKVKKHCWETECKPVCIPRVHCPLLDFFRKDKCETCSSGIFKGKSLCNRCADVRVVKKLKKVEYECEKCVVEWNVQCVSPGCGKCCDSVCVPGSCCQIQ